MLQVSYRPLQFTQSGRELLVLSQATDPWYVDHFYPNIRMEECGPKDLEDFYSNEYQDKRIKEMGNKFADHIISSIQKQCLSLSENAEKVVDCGNRLMGRAKLRESCCCELGMFALGVTSMISIAGLANYGLYLLNPGLMGLGIPLSGLIGWNIPKFVKFLQEDASKCGKCSSYKEFAQDIDAFQKQFKEQFKFDELPEYLGDQSANPYTLSLQLEFAQKIVDGGLNRTSLERLLDWVCFQNHHDYWRRKGWEADFLKEVSVDLHAATNKFSTEFFRNLPTAHREWKQSEHTKGIFRNRMINLIQLGAWAERRNFQEMRKIIDFTSVAQAFHTHFPEPDQAKLGKEAETKEKQAKLEVEDQPMGDHVINIHVLKTQGSPARSGEQAQQTGELAKLEVRDLSKPLLGRIRVPNLSLVCQ